MQRMVCTGTNVSYESDIISTIENSYKQGVISRADMNILIALSYKLLEHLYSKYSNIKEVDNMLHDESMDLEIDKVYDQLDLLNEKLAECLVPQLLAIIFS